MSDPIVKATNWSIVTNKHLMALEKPPKEVRRPGRKATWGILADHETDEVPGTVKLVSSSTENEPLGSQQAECHKHAKQPPCEDTNAKKTPDGRFVLNPQPEDTPNDPLNWPAWRRDCALLSLGFYCMLGGGMTPILAAGFNDVAATFGVSFSQVALTTGLYMMGLGIGSVIASPTAIIIGKRPVYLFSSILFLLSLVWCALAPSYSQLVVARVFQGIAVSPVECLPSATIAEIFFLHERAFRVGIYTLLLLGGKNLIPLVSAAIIQAKDWRWVFWIFAIIVVFGALLLFFFVPETFWDRTPRPRKITRTLHRLRSGHEINTALQISNARASDSALTLNEVKLTANTRVDGDFADAADLAAQQDRISIPAGSWPGTARGTHVSPHLQVNAHAGQPVSDDGDAELAHGSSNDVSTHQGANAIHEDAIGRTDDGTDSISSTATTLKSKSPALQYTRSRRESPTISYLHTLKPWTGRFSRENWFLVALRPFVLYAYPSVLWSSMVYAFSVGWLIVLSESVARIYENRNAYNFTALQVGLVYISPFVGGVLGTAVAGRFSDVVVRFMARRNGGIYEPEFRLVMAVLIAISTVLGLMGFGWSAAERDNFMVPTIFFGIISFGCCMGSTTAITYVVDAYRQFAGEALVTLNFTKNILHGLVWSLFFPKWLESDGPKVVFLGIGGIQLAGLALTIPMYVYGKKARMWTVRKRMMEKL